MATLESAARIIHRPETPSAQAVPSSREPETESKTDLFTQDELFGVKKGQYIKKARARVLADIESLYGNCRWQDIVSLYHPVEEKLPELDEAGMADMVKEKIAFAMGHLKQFDDAISLLAACIRNDPDNFYTRSSLAYTAYSSLFAAKNREIFLAGAPRARRIELAHENFTRARKLRPDGVTNNYRHAMLYLQIQNKPKPALHLLNQAVANWENLSEEDQSRRHQEKKNYVKSLYRSASVLLANGEALKALERIHSLTAAAVDFCDIQPDHTGYIHPLIQVEAWQKMDEKKMPVSGKVQNLTQAVENLKIAIQQVERFLS
jgi:tetratricopeptide (TPR) repeat protein